MITIKASDFIALGANQALIALTRDSLSFRLSTWQPCVCLIGVEGSYGHINSQKYARVVCTSTCLCLFQRRIACFTFIQMQSYCCWITENISNMLFFPPNEREGTEWRDCRRHIAAPRAWERERREREREAPVENEIAATSWCHV